MKRRLLLVWLVATFGWGLTASAQFGHKINFEFVSTYYNGVRSATVVGVSDTAVHFIFKRNTEDIKADRVPKTPILLGYTLAPDCPDVQLVPVQSISKSYSSYLLPDTASVTMIGMGINKNNINDYRYRVVENDSVERVPWSEIPKLEQGYGAKQAYGFIGRFKAPGKQLLVEVKNIRDYSIRDGIIFDWRADFKPVLSQIAVFARNKEHRTEFFNLNDSAVNKGYATRFDPRTKVPVDFKFSSGTVIVIRMFFEHHETIPYTASLIRKMKSVTDTVRVGSSTGDYLDVNVDLYSGEGEYEIVVQREGRLGEWGERQMLRIPFEVLPTPILDKSVPIEAVIFFTVVLLILIGLVFLIFYRRHKRKLKQAAQEKQFAGLKLGAIRAQLNPHFMFNALTSIQNLINKNNVEDANYYLSKFAELTRRVLDSSNEELLSIEEERRLINDYLQMEQLRFNFKYNICVDDQLDQANIDIPAMLLQPFVENAVKHGVSGLKEKGEIMVKIAGEGKDVLLSVKDNGRGFEVREKCEGHGLKLSETYVALLNQIYKDRVVLLQILSKENGTLITIRLSNWIA